MMKIAITVVTLLCASPGWAACYADYKAKQDSPLKLHYGVVQLPDNACNRNAARRNIARRLARGGWNLLDVMAVFDESGLGSRRGRAGEYFLKY